jgi:glucosamine--fructose-6-phosphate aminotransferase (isomerizing)
MSAPSTPVRSVHTLAEILSQPEIWIACQRQLASDAAFKPVSARLAAAKEILFVGCGSSLYLAESAAAVWTSTTGRRTRALAASELLLFPQLCQLDVADLHVVVISRSGKTSEAVRAADFLTKKRHLPTIGITCAVDSELSKFCDLTVALPTADEKSMVMTRSFTSMLQLLAGLAESQLGDSPSATDVEKVSAAIASRIQAMNERIESFVAKHTFADYIYLAQGPFFPVVREAALKVTEMSCSYAQAYHTLEFRHGPKSIVAPETCLTFFLSDSAMQAESEVLIEMKQLGGTIVAICNRAPDSIRRSVDLWIEVEANVPELALMAPFLVPAQLLGFYTGVKKGLNPDEPKNLSRAVILD